ncbi:RHS repeat-associated core domain-containing protein [Streptomyces canus]|uniref:RHS repeat-associated core domain-containing protein n=1 Tax=Streptomyces canus TaxID=58343 RepID=UPI00225BFF7A|nr:RHS repeat-associated core domain-containing protein [Streptomyces canus]MCX5261242.1 RHS repeat-associated core domain-containing protein [Streptomyces canus]
MIGPVDNSFYKMGARYYDPNLGRFTQPDPSGQEGNAAYLYAGGAPVNHSDPTGLSFFRGLGKIFGASDHGPLAAHLIKGDWKGAGATAIGIWAGAVTQMACEAALAALPVPTAGIAGFAGQGCASAPPTAWATSRKAGQQTLCERTAPMHDPTTDVMARGAAGAALPDRLWIVIVIALLALAAYRISRRKR